MKHDNNFDLLRLVAALDVLMQHAQHLNLVFPVWCSEIVITLSGVPIFFVISGFLVTGSFFGRDGDAPAYFASRALRIYPALWFNLAIIFTMLLAFGNLHASTIPTPYFVKFALAMLATGSITLADRLSSFPLYWNESLPYFPGGALWTIVLELGFYLMVPLIYLAPVRRNRAAAVASVAFWIVVSYAMASYLRGSPTGLMQIINPLTYFWIFGIGSLCNLLWPQIKFLFEGKFLIWIAALAASRYFSGDVEGPAFTSPGPFATMLVLLLAGASLSFAFSMKGLARFLGGNDISYGVYLHHMPIVMILLAFGITGSVYSLVLLIGSTAAVSTLSWFAIERPALRLKRNVRSPRTSSPDPAGTPAA